MSPSSKRVTAAPDSFFVVGGTLQRDAPCYVERNADAELFDGLTSREYCFVLTSRQMGKSSLMVRTAARLRSQGTLVVLADLTSLGQNLSAEQWYVGLLAVVGEQLGCEDELEAYWHSHMSVGPLKRWLDAIRTVVLAKTDMPLVIFVDEIDTVLSLPFPTDEFFAGIREFYNRRTSDKLVQRVTFCLLGVATPSDLIKDQRTTPFNIGRRIDLADFDVTDSQPLLEGLGRDGRECNELLNRILYWTSGQPYLTQRMCQAVAEDPSISRTRDVDRLCYRLYLSPKAREQDDNLVFVRDRLLRSHNDRAELLSVYGQVYVGKGPSTSVDSDPIIDTIRLSGIAKDREGRLTVRNRIYSSVFNKNWIKSSMPDAEHRRLRAAFWIGVRLASTAAAAFVGVLATIILGLAVAGKLPMSCSTVNGKSGNHHEALDASLAAYAPFSGGTLASMAKPNGTRVVALWQCEAMRSSERRGQYCFSRQPSIVSSPSPPSGVKSAMSLETEGSPGMRAATWAESIALPVVRRAWSEVTGLLRGW